MIQTRSEAWEYLSSFERFGMRFRLEVIEALLRERGNPHRRFEVLHVGGTNGKGSVVAFLSESLRRAGYRVGRYTSPHLVRFEERIVVEGKEISTADLVHLLEEIRPAIERVRESVGPPTFFEVGTLLAFEYFARCGVDLAVVEVGLGGRRDATNVFEKPLVTVITNVGRDHMDVLGSTIEEIATEKAGILKAGTPLVTAARGKALEVLVGEAAKVDAGPIRIVSRTREPGAIVVHPRERTLERQRFELEGCERDHGVLETTLVGEHQFENAALAVVALDEVDKRGFPVPLEAIREGLRTTRFPGRLQFVPGSPRLLLDGAHNPPAVESLALFLRENSLRPLLLMGVLKDKEWLPMVMELAPLVEAVVTTTVPSPRSLDPQDLAREFSRAGVVATVVRDPRHALETARRQARRSGLLLVTGSLYLVGEVLAALHDG